jgi:hypothetical protein
MEPISAGILALGLIKAGGSLSAGFDAAGQKRREVDEAVRRLRLQNERTLGLAKLAGASSGQEFESASLQTYLATMSGEFTRQQNWMKVAGASEADAMKSAAGFNAFTDVASSLFQFGSANNWFREPALKPAK